MPHFLLVKACIQPGSSPAIPYLVGDPSSPKRFVGVKVLPAPAEGPGKAPPLAHRASGWTPAPTVVLDDRFLRAEVDAGCLAIINQADADDLAAARAILEK